MELADYWHEPHVNLAAQYNTKRAVLLSKDTDAIVIMLRYIDVFKSNKLLELWVEVSSGKKQQFPHSIFLRKELDPDLSHDSVSQRSRSHWK